MMLSVRLSVRHTRESRLNGSRYRNILYIVRYVDISSLLDANFVVLNLGVLPFSRTSALQRVTLQFIGTKIDYRDVNDLERQS